MSKTVSFKTVKPATADDWVTGGGRPAEREIPARPAVTAAPAPAAPEAMKRFTIDVPVGLHSRIKMECARRSVKMADVLRELLEREFPEA
jgi:hypothetical protein